MVKYRSNGSGVMFLQFPVITDLMQSVSWLTQTVSKVADKFESLYNDGHLHRLPYV